MRAALAAGAALSLLGRVPLALSRLRGPDPEGGYGPEGCDGSDEPA